MPLSLNVAPSDKRGMGAILNFKVASRYCRVALLLRLAKLERRLRIIAIESPQNLTTPFQRTELMAVSAKSWFSLPN
jgi:hypothetical protein